VYDHVNNLADAGLLIKVVDDNKHIIVFCADPSILETPGRARSEYSYDRARPLTVLRRESPIGDVARLDQEKAAVLLELSVGPISMWRTCTFGDDLRIKAVYELIKEKKARIICRVHRNQ
jgi:hypothetical protein